MQVIGMAVQREREKLIVTINDAHHSTHNLHKNK